MAAAEQTVSKMTSDLVMLSMNLAQDYQRRSGYELGSRH
jgi:hypothetical protein